MCFPDSVWELRSLIPCVSDSELRENLRKMPPTVRGADEELRYEIRVVSHVQAQYQRYDLMGVWPVEIIERVVWGFEQTLRPGKQIATSRSANNAIYRGKKEHNSVLLLRRDEGFR